jgi:hypothetical protein
VQLPTAVLAGLVGVGVDVGVLVPDPGPLDTLQVASPQYLDLLAGCALDVCCASARVREKESGVKALAAGHSPEPRLAEGASLEPP